MDGGVAKLSEDDKAMLAMWDSRMSTASIAAIMGRSEARVDKRLAELRAGRKAATVARVTTAAVEAAVAQARALPVRTIEGKRIATGMLLLAAGLVTLREYLESCARAPAKATTKPRPATPAKAAAAVAPPKANQPPVAGGPEPEAEATRAKHRRFTPAEDDVIRRCWRDHPGHAGGAAASMLDRPIGSIRWRAHMLGLRQDGAPRVDAPPMLRLRKPSVSRPIRARPVAMRIKALTPRVLRWCGQFHVADWPVDEIADLFDLDCDELARALGQGSVAA